MLRFVLLCVFIVFRLCASAQVLISFEFTSEDENKPVKENDSCKCYIATGDTSHTVCIYEEGSYYKLFNRTHKLIAEGAFIAEGDKFYQDGKWIARFESGRVKRTGYYKHGLAVGTWEEFYSNGKIRTIRNYAIFDDGGELSSCLSGTCQEYYQNGNMKSNGFYVAVLTTINDTMVVDDPVTGQSVRRLVQHRKIRPEKMAQWENFNENGEAEKKEDKDN